MVWLQPLPNVQVYDEALSLVGGNYFEGWRSYTGLSNPLSPMKGMRHELPDKSTKDYT
ncbi:MAG: hypothetical protein IPH78_08890 [Bacteroidetes bacterium]|nr:hypothetical protein [Bacteroidota bacterium]